MMGNLKSTPLSGYQWGTLMKNSAAMAEHSICHPGPALSPRRLPPCSLP